mgnify:CR=1 FL=1
MSEYDRHPTDPHHGGKLSYHQMPARIEKLEAENARLLEAALAARNEATEQPGRPPLLVKIAPDLSEDELKDIAGKGTP